MQARSTQPALARLLPRAVVGDHVLETRAAAAAEAGFDVQLSGHTHGGQFWPWNLFVRLHRARKQLLC